jgi:hypothetical protein
MAALRIDPFLVEHERLVREQDAIWKQLADPFKKLDDEQTLELTRRYRELCHRLEELEKTA